MTLGHDGALAYDGSEWWYSPGFEVSCMDTTGAGDVFHGAFCYGVLAGSDWGAVLEFANAAAALNCTAFGARGKIASLHEIRCLSGFRRRRVTSPVSLPKASASATRSSQGENRNE